jgi:signal transduction histidine kinase
MRDRGRTAACGTTEHEYGDAGNADSHRDRLAGRKHPRRVILRSSRFAQWGELAVEDTEPGIPPGDLGHIFEPFYRGHGVGQPGTGIGLATVHRIVESHGGTISVASAVDVGTVFTLRLPLATPCGSENSRGAVDTRTAQPARPTA